MNLFTNLLKRIFRSLGEALTGKQEKMEYAPIRVKASQPRFPRK